MVFNIAQTVRELIRDTFSGISSMYEIPSPLHAIIQDPTTSKRYGCSIAIAPDGILDVGPFGELREGITPTPVADRIIKDHPETSLLCDRQTVDELGKDSTLFYEANYVLVKRPHGVIQVYHPKYKEVEM